MKPCCTGRPQVACVLWGVWMGLRGLTVLPGKWVVWSWWSAMRHVEKMKLRADIQSTPQGSAGSDVRTPTPTRRYPYPLPPGGLWTPVLPYLSLASCPVMCCCRHPYVPLLPSNGMEGLSPIVNPLSSRLKCNSPLALGSKMTLSYLLVLKR